MVLEQPWGIFIMFLCIVSGLASLLGPHPGSIARVLPPAAVVAWNLTLVIGSCAGLAGMLRPVWFRLEVAGLIWLGTAAVVYAATIVWRFGWSGLVAGAIVFGFGLSAMIRALAVAVSFEIAKRAAR